MNPSVRRSRFALPALAGLALASLAAHAAAQTAPTWVPLVSTVPPGTPAVLELDATASSPSRTQFELRIFGFWRESVVGADGTTYDRLSFPGLGEVGVIGAPELPAARTRLSVVTGAPSASLLTATVQPGDVVTFPMNVYPMPKPAADGSDDLGDGDPDGEPEVFVKDGVLYATNASWPPSVATASAPVELQHGQLLGSAVELFPVRFNPVTQELEVARRTVYHYNHFGFATPQPPITKDLAKLAKATYLNWPIVDAFAPADTAVYHARYLIVTPEVFLPRLQTFIEHRKSTGFQVTVRTLESLPAVTCGEIRGAIDQWYQSGPANQDHYCLLVGDSGAIPLCPSATTGLIPGDDRYGSPSGTGDLDEEVFVGRISSMIGTEVEEQLAKIIAYELDSNPAHDYRDVLLVAHKEDAPGKYEGAHEAVANASYDVPPSFQKIYGSSLLSSDADVLAAIQANLGLVAYRGHGTSKTWIDWNVLGENLTDVEVGALAQGQRPVVWSFSCTNNAIDTSGTAIGEAWMKADGGAVAHYGSTRASGTTKNHTLDAKMFEAVYRHGITTHGQAIAWAEAQMDAAHPDNAWQNSWMYMLLGCPAMKIRRDAPKPLSLAAPSTVPVTPNGQPFTVQVLDASGAPVVGALVSVWKAPFDPSMGPDELFAAVYTGTSGAATIPGPTSLGILIVTGRDDDGNLAQETINGQAGAFVKLGQGTAGTGGVVPRLESSSTLAPGSKTTIKVRDARPDAVGLLLVAGQAIPIPVFGGIVHVLPELFSVPFQCDALGHFDFVVDPWPDGFAPGTRFVFQAGLLDANAIGGVALTNALDGKTP